MNTGSKGQAILEYLLMIVLVAVLVATAIRSTNDTLYQYWTGLAGKVAAPCPEPGCQTQELPEL